MFYFSDIFKNKKFWFFLVGLVVAAVILRNNWNLIAGGSGGGEAGPNRERVLPGKEGADSPHQEETRELLEGEEAAYGLHPPVESDESGMEPGGGMHPADGSPEAQGGRPGDGMHPEDGSHESPGKEEQSAKKPVRKNQEASSYRKIPPTAHQSYVTERFICPLQSEPMLYILLQLELIYEDPALEKEIVEKRDQMTAVVQNLIFTKEKTQLNADYLREEVKKALNSYLKQGNLADIIFKDFKLEIRKSK